MNSNTRHTIASEFSPVRVADEPKIAEQTSVKRVTEYTPSGHIGMGFGAWCEMVQELWESRELTWRLFLRDFSARYRQSLLGYVWAFLPPLIMVATFTWLNRNNILPVGETKLPYPVYVLLGTTVWQLFASGLTGATQSLVGASALITKINFPREVLVLSAFMQSLLEFFVRCFLLVAAFAFYRVVPSPAILLLPLAVIPLCLLTLGLGYIFALINGVLRDAGQIITFLLTFWMFLTPVVYPAATTGAKSILNVANPVSPFVIAAQDLASYGALSQPQNYLIGCGISLVVFLLGWRLFHLAETRIVERV